MPMAYSPSACRTARPRRPAPKAIASTTWHSAVDTLVRPSINRRGSPTTAARRRGRNPDESEAHGCTLVTVDDSGNVKTSFVATDSIRWITETMEVTAGTDEDALMTQMQNRIAKLQTKHSGSRLLITWKIEGRGQVLNHIRRGGISDQMVELLCQQYGHGSPEIWTVAIECDEPLDVPQEWVDEETIMGDMLREFRALEADIDIPLRLEEFLPEELLGTPRAELAAVAEEDRAGLLWAASKMAVDLLDGEEELTT